MKSHDEAENVIAQLADNEGESRIVFSRHSAQRIWWNGKVRIVVRCNVSYEHWKSHDEGENDIAQFTDKEGEPHILVIGTSVACSWWNSELRW